MTLSIRKKKGEIYMKHYISKIAQELFSLNIQLFAEQKNDDDHEIENHNDQKDNEEDSKEENTASNSEQEKEQPKYTDKQVNDISTKNSNKAIKKLLKELGVEDVETAKQLLGKARADEENNKTPEDKTNDLKNMVSQKDSIIQEKNKKLAEAVLELRLNASGIIDQGKLNRAKKLISYYSIVDEDGEIDEEMVQKEIKNLLKDFPEFKSEKEVEKKGFQFGTDGIESKNDSKKYSNYQMPKKKWNRFN